MTHDEYFSNISDDTLDLLIIEIYKLHTKTIELKDLEYLPRAEEDFKIVESDYNYVNAILLEYSFRKAKFK